VLYPYQNLPAGEFAMSTDRYKEGLRIRKEVVGEAEVDKWLAEADEFTGPLEDITIEFGWGTIWARPGLSRKTRSLLTIALLAAQNRPDELTVHLRNAVTNGCTHEEIREALLHTAAYCGIPTARSSIKLASRVLGQQHD
jgi:alkylhydroperoxidase/carboxymuconolactone decarboxylase family protein YurZ